eukprot:scaffold353_cov185-Amphora_coffeaeformis.AAC.34
MASQNAARKAWNEAMKATAGTAALPPALLGRPQKRRSGRNKKQERRAKARKVAVTGESDEYNMAVWIDSLEGVDPAVVVDDDEEFDELGKMEGTTKGKRRRGKGGSKAKTGALPKRFLPRTLASILMDEHGREDSTARLFMCAEPRLTPDKQLPRRRFCPVTGLEGIYTEPKSGIPYANLKSLEQIRERSPPWMTLGGAAAYLEATKSIRDEEY